MITYEDMVDRNLGIINEEQQALLKNSCVAVFGIGGLGGIIVEILCRSGIGHIKIIEPDNLEPSNLNRHVFCFHSTVGMKKNDVAEKFLKDINPGSGHAYPNNFIYINGLIFFIAEHPTYGEEIYKLYYN